MDHIDITYSNGRTVRITAQDSGYGYPVLVGRDDGRVVGEGQRLREVNDRERHHRGWTSRVTHALQYLPIPAEHVDDVKGILRAAEAARSATPKRQAERLRRDRERLVTAVSVLTDADTEARAAAFDRGELDAHLRPGGAGESYAARIKEARAALAEFDRDHPEVRQVVEAERAADVQRWASQ